MNEKENRPCSFCILVKGRKKQYEGENTVAGEPICIFCKENAIDVTHALGNQKWQSTVRTYWLPLLYRHRVKNEDE